MLLNARRLNETGASHAAQVMSGDRIVRSLIPVASAPAAFQDRFVFAADRDSGRVIAASRKKYEINVWSKDGTLVDSARRNAGWFVVVPDAQRQERGPSAYLSGVARAETGGFWVMGQRTSPNWKRLTTSSATTPNGEIGGGVGPSFDRLFISVLELITERGDSVAAIELPGLGFALTNGLVATYRVRDDGVPIVEVWRPELR
jgi:hypothetical protein